MSRVNEEDDGENRRHAAGEQQGHEDKGYFEGNVKGGGATLKVESDGGMRGNFTGMIQFEFIMIRVFCFEDYCGGSFKD